MASSLWLVMQVIESNRHSAEQLETAASTADPALAVLLNEIAAESRRFADEIHRAVMPRSAASGLGRGWPARTAPVTRNALARLIERGRGFEDQEAQSAGRRKAR
jgi:hypothetical protein